MNELFYAAADASIAFHGQVSLESDADGRVTPWRVPYADRQLYFPGGGSSRGAMTTAVRIGFHTDSVTLTCHYNAKEPPTLQGPPEIARADVVCDGSIVATIDLDTSGSAAELTVDRLPLGDKLIQIWLPNYSQFTLHGIQVAGGARVRPEESRRPRWVHFGSSISLGRGAPSPSRTWPVLVARAAGLEHTSLAMGAACHLQPMFARLMRDLSSEILSCCIGINIYALGSLNEYTFADNLIGFIATVRDGHPDTPFAVMSSIYSPDAEDEPGPTGMTLRQYRTAMEDVVESLRSRGDSNLHYVDGLDILGPADSDFMLETGKDIRLHVNPAGQRRVAQRVVRRLRTLIDMDALRSKPTFEDVEENLRSM